MIYFFFQLRKAYQASAKAVHPGLNGMIKSSAYNLPIIKGKKKIFLKKKKAYPPSAVGKAEFCKLQKLTCFIMEMITLFRSG